VKWAFSVDPQQQLSEQDELEIIRCGAALGYESAWTPSGPDAAACERCLRSYDGGLPAPQLGQARFDRST
jgi:hypothetical protein